MPTIPPPPLAEARALLAAVRLFQGLPEAALDEVAAQLGWSVVAGGTVICAQGEVGDSLYVVACGRLAVERENPDGSDQLLREVARGETVGELAILADVPRSATVRATRDTVLARLARDRVAALVERHPAVLRQVTRLLAEWLEGRQRPAPAAPCMSLAVVPAGLLAPLPELTAGLAAALGQLGSTRVLDEPAIDARFGAGAAASPDGSAVHGAVTRWLAEQESAHRFLLYRADGAGPWARRAVRQTDRVLVAAAADAPPAHGAIGVLLERTGRAADRRRDELVLLQTGGARARDTARWLEIHPFRAHHHVRLDAAADLARLARQVSSRGVGLVLGGGGARGFAHIGVLRALEEAGVPIDRVGGASMGAFIAAQHAYGYGWRDMVELNRRGWIEMAPHKLYTIPVISLLSKAKAERMLEMMFAGAHIEDLPTPFFCVSTNLTRTEVVVHRSGPLRRALAASMTIPGITPPIVAPHGELLVDGGVLNNLPIDVMRRVGDGPIVASDVSALFDLRADPTWDDAPTPWQYLAGRLRRGPRPRPFPSILDLIMRAALLASDVYAKQAKGEVELYLDLPMEPFGMFEVHRLARLAGCDGTAAGLASEA